MLQLREKSANQRAFIQYASRVRETISAFGIPLIINDDVAVALAVEADGVHLGQQDFPLELARRIMGPDKIIGLSAHTKEEALEAQRMGADYVGVGAVFSTRTKSNLRGILGPEGFVAIRKAISLPAVAIGGITYENARPLILGGAAGIAVASAIMLADDPEVAAASFRELWKTSKTEYRGV